MSHKSAASISQQPDQLRREALYHSVSGDRQIGDTETPGQQFGMDELFGEQAAIDLQKFWDQGLDLGIQIIQRLGLCYQARNIVGRCHPNASIGVPFGPNKVELVHTFIVRQCRRLHLVGIFRSFIKSKRTASL